MSKTNSFDLFTRYLSQRDSIVQELHEANQIRSKPMDVQARWVNSVTSKLVSLSRVPNNTWYILLEIAFNGLREELEIQNQPFPGVNEDTPEFSIYLQVKQSYLQLKELLEQGQSSMDYIVRS